ncbi:MAG: hypothetical protein RBT45_05045 [Acholeplasmataceae bacterium]|jgi:hypothetical protein|nr:hypothetical protein [Acholeplasmataceae bacterium]
MNAYHVAELLIEKIKKDYKDDISVVVMMGSRIYHDTHEKSDLDLYFVPKTQKGYNLGFVFTMEGIGFDLWPISWERLEKIASWHERIVSIVTEGKILWYSSEDDLNRFNTLKEHALSKDLHPVLKDRAKTKFKEAYHIYFNMYKHETLSGVRKDGIKLLYLISEVIAMYHQIPVKRGRKHLKGEMLNMPNLPHGFSDLYEAVFSSKDIKYIKCSFQELITRMEMWFQDKHKVKETPFHIQAHGFYEEIINNYNKIERACLTGDYYTALFAAAEIEFEFDWLFYETDVKKDLPDLLSFYHKDHLDEFLVKAKEHQAALLKCFNDNNVPILTFKDMDEFETYLNQK